MNVRIAVYSETGGATKTTTAVSLATAFARRGRTVLLIDLDPRAAASKWLGFDLATEDKDTSWRHVGAILSDENPTGWADDLARPAPWEAVPTLSIVPSARSVSNREKATEDHSDQRLAISLEGSKADIVVIDMPNRQGGPLVQNALNAVAAGSTGSGIAYAAKFDEDGQDGVDGAMLSVQKFRANRQRLGAPDNIRDLGIVVGLYRDNIPSRDAKRARDELIDRYGTLVLEPYIPERVIVREARNANRYFGEFRNGDPVNDAYEQVARQILPQSI